MTKTTTVTVNGVTVTRLSKTYTCRCRDRDGRRARVRCMHGPVTRVTWQTSDGSNFTRRKDALAHQANIEGV